jgi:hypothetical protein
MKNRFKLILNLVVIIFVFTSCNQELEKRIQDQQAEIENLQEENKKLKDVSGLGYTSAPNGVIDNGNSFNNNYSSMSNKQLNETFKNYMSDSYFGFESFRVKGKTVKVEASFVMNTSIRALQRENQSIFNELLNRYDKIVFWDQFGKSITISRLDE